MIFIFQTGIVFDRAESAGADSFRVHIEALKVQEDVHAAFSLARGIIAEINKLVIGLETGTGENLLFTEFFYRLLCSLWLNNQPVAYIYAINTEYL